MLSRAASFSAGRSILAPDFEARSAELRARLLPPTTPWTEGRRAGAESLPPKGPRPGTEREGAEQSCAPTPRPSEAPPPSPGASGGTEREGAASETRSCAEGPEAPSPGRETRSPEEDEEEKPPEKGTQEEETEEAETSKTEETTPQPPAREEKKHARGLLKEAPASLDADLELYSLEALKKLARSRRVELPRAASREQALARLRAAR